MNGQFVYLPNLVGYLNCSGMNELGVVGGGGLWNTRAMEYKGGKMMIRVAFIPPIKFLSLSHYGDMYMILAPLCEYSQYIQFFRSVKGYKILDNGAYELEEKGVGLSFERVINLALKVDADEIVLTDYVYDSNRTLEAVKECVNLVKKRNLVNKFRLHAVPQGSSVEECLTCFNSLMEMDEIDVIGLSKLSVPYIFYGNTKTPGYIANSRKEILKKIVNNKNYEICAKGIRLKGKKKWKKIHLLGAGPWLAYELSILKKYSFIRSVDTSMPIWYGIHGLKIDYNTGTINKILKKVNLLYMNNISYEQISTIMHNIAVILKYRCHQRGDCNG
ncbi:MAG: hypothetical protein B5M53_11030 [Candidatus Cloacimonas sp. 4484_209]|nr:MAG: hypothetical protein B5M53_11030 [Candidatus Cloacimonas sp. 4484_209]